MRRFPKGGGQFAIIWADLLYEDSIPATAKLLFGEIYRCSGPDGYCNATNEELMDFLGCSERTVRGLLKALEDVGQIRIEVLGRRKGDGGTQRRIFCGRKLAPADMETSAEVAAKNCRNPVGSGKKLPGVAAKNCRAHFIEKNNNITPISPREVRDVISAYAAEDAELLEALESFVRNRAAPPKSKPVKTAYGMKRLLQTLDKVSAGDRGKKLAIVAKSIDRNWLGFFELDEDKPKAIPSDGQGAFGWQ